MVPERRQDDSRHMLERSWFMDHEPRLDTHHPVLTREPNEGWDATRPLDAPVFLNG